MGKRFLCFTFKIPQLKGNSSKILFPFIISKNKGDIRAIAGLTNRIYRIT